MIESEDLERIIIEFATRLGFPDGMERGHAVVPRWAAKEGISKDALDNLVAQARAAVNTILEECADADADINDLTSKCASALVAFFGFGWEAGKQLGSAQHD